MNIKKLTTYSLCIAVFAIAVWAFWAFAYPAHLHLWEQLQCFEYTSDYALDVMVKPACVAEYVGRYLTQFFYSDTLGPVIMAAMLTLLYICTLSAATSLASSKPTARAISAGKAMPAAIATAPVRQPSLMTCISMAVLATVPAILACTFMMSTDAKLTMPVALTIALFCVWLTAKIPAKARLMVAAVLSVVLSYAIGSVFVVYVVLMFGNAIVQQLRLRRYTQAIEHLGEGAILWFAIVKLLAATMPYPQSVLQAGDYYNRFVFIPADYNITTWVVAIAIVIIIACYLASPWAGMPSAAAKPSDNGKRPGAMRWLTSALALVVAVGGCVYAILTMQKSYSAAEESMLDSMYKVRQQQWDDIIAKAQQQAPASPYEQTFLNLALAMKGQLADRLFNFQNQSAETLLPVYKMEYMTPLLSAETYYHMGMVNTCQRFYYEAMESIADHQKSARYLQRLTQTAIANGRLNLAMRYLHKLKNTLYYREWAEQMEQKVRPQLSAQGPASIVMANDTAAVKQPKAFGDPEIDRLRAQNFQQDIFFNDTDPEITISQLLNEHPKNELGWQYLFSMLMVKGQLDALMQTAQFYAKHFPDKFFPVHVQEALLYTWVTKTGSLNNFPWKIQAQIGQRFMDFAQKANQPADVAEPVVRRDFVDTFWCYAVFKQQQMQAQQQAGGNAPDARTGASRQN